MTTTEERLALLAQRRNRPAGRAADAPEATSLVSDAERSPTPAAPRPRARRQAVAPLTRIVVTSLSASAVLAGAGFLAFAERAASTPTSSQGDSTRPVPEASGAAPPVRVVVVREAPATVVGAQPAVTDPLSGIAPPAVPQASPLGAAAPGPAVTAPPPAKAVQPVTTTKKS